MLMLGATTSKDEIAVMMSDLWQEGNSNKKNVSHFRKCVYTKKIQPYSGSSMMHVFIRDCNTMETIN